jgi:hypothetical protein
LLTAYRKTTADLTGIGGRSDNAILSGVVQEIDIATGKLLFSWDSLDHVDPSESYLDPTTNADDVLDYFHINSIDRTSENELLISARNTCTIYSVDKTTGKINWRLGGTASDFTHGAGTRFYFQHCATWRDTSHLMVFDNGSSPAKEEQSRGLILQLEIKARKVTLTRAFTHPAKLLADSQGSIQRLGNRTYLVGWGAEPYFSEFAADGTLLLDAKLPDNVQSYRTLAGDWTGKPRDDPKMSIGSNAARGATAYLSWNGATDVARWRVRAGSKPEELSHHATASRSGFETAVAVNSTGPYFQGIALDSAGTELGRTETVHATF